MRIELPRGAYVPVLRWATPAERTGEPRADAARSDGPRGRLAHRPRHRRARRSRPGARRRVGPVPGSPGRRAGPVSGRARRASARSGSPRGRPPAPTRGSLSPGVFSRDEEGLGLIARLVDCRAGSQVWAEEYRRGSDATRAFPEETARVVAARVASEQGLVAKLLWAERRAHPPAELTPYGGDPRLLPVLLQPRSGGPRAPRSRPCGVVVAAEPECSLAWVQLSRLYNTNYAFEVTPLETPIDQAVAYAQNGVRLDPSSQRARAALAGALLVKGELAAARAEVAGRARAQPGLPRLPRVDRLADDAARRVGARPRPAAASARPQSPRHPGRPPRPLARPPAPRGDRGGPPGRPAVPRPDLLPAGHDAGLLPRPPRPARGGEAGGGRAPRDEARLPEPRPHPDRPARQVPRPATRCVVGGLEKAGLPLDRE